MTAHHHREDDGRVICETCEGLADPDDISTTEEGRLIFCGCRPFFPIDVTQRINYK